MSNQKDLFGTEPNQIRLAELSLYNWGSFNGLHTAKIDPQGTLITGDNGTGKSTFIDALMVLLQPAGKAMFNVAAAQGERGDRSLISYMRGSFGSVHDGVGVKVQSKREKSVISGVRALYRGDNGMEITLVVLFSIPSASNSLSDVKRIYLIAKKDLPLKTVLDKFTEGSGRQLKLWLKDQPEIICCDDSYSDYFELYRKLLSMENKNAPALLSRALGLKKIDDLTKLIRELVLEPNNIREEARAVVDEFSDLVAIHDHLLDAREQLNHLKDLPKVAQNIERLSTEYALLRTQKQGIPRYFAENESAILQEKMIIIQQNLTALSQQLQQLLQQEKDYSDATEQRYAEYLQLGGERIEILRREVDSLRLSLQKMIKQASQYQQICQQLQLNDSLTEQQFLDNTSLITEKLASIQQELEENINQRATLLGKSISLKEEGKKLEQQWQEMSARPNSNIDIAYLKLRDELVSSLGFEEQELLFIGELLDVKEQEKSWQGAIERALGGKRTTLLVSEKRYRQVTQWLNSRHTGLFVRLQAVGSIQNLTPVTFKENGFLNKLIWREHAYQQWLKAYLEKSDLICVGNVEQLNATSFSMTQEGLIQFKQGYFEKKDKLNVNDRRQWQLGFNNKQKLILLENEKREIAQQIIELHRAIEQVKLTHEQLQQVQRNWEKLNEIQWEEIDVPRYQQKLLSSEETLKALESSEGDLHQAKLRWETAKERLKAAQDQKTQIVSQQAITQTEKENIDKRLAQLQTYLQIELKEDIRRLLAKRIGQVRIDDPHQRTQADADLDSVLAKTNNQKGSEENKAVSIMGKFRGNEKWLPLTVEWGTEMMGLPDYLAYLDTLEKEGLPNLLEQFKSRLNKHTTQSLARLQNRFESEFEHIRERISKINNVLQRTEFRQHSYLKLGSRREKYAHIVEFDRKVKQALNAINHTDHEQRFKLLQDVVNILDKASNSASSYTLESQRLLDPRYQLNFFAEEINRETLVVLDVLGSSSSKSGGEKESFAGTILAASLAYVLTPEDADRPVYCTVFLDEAFSNTAESVSRRVLNVFKALHIHVNLITPFKNLNLAQESARSLLITERDVERHESHLCEITWEELDHLLAEKQRKEQTLLTELGVEIEYE
ncbi:ATP-binding protein [Ursidibacter arcticus]